MRWDSLFDDLEGQLEQELTAESEDLRAEEERLRVSRLTLRDRIRAATAPGVAITLRLLSGDRITVATRALGRDWLSGEAADTGAAVIVPLAAIASVILVPAAAAETTAPPPDTESGLTARLGLAFVLRDLARRRVSVAVDLVSGRLTGTIDRVGRDHLDLAIHDLDVPRRSGAVRSVEVVALSAVLTIRPHAGGA